MNICTVRGILIGSRLQFEQINRAIEANEIHPVVDEKVFELSQVREAHGYMWDRKHYEKLCVKIEKQDRISRVVGLEGRIWSY